MRRAQSPDGLHHTRDINEKPASKPKYVERMKKQNEDIEVCRSCTRKKCSGTKACIEKRRRELQIQNSPAGSGNCGDDAG